jgi:selenocysteine-specific elongation factor
MPEEGDRLVLRQIAPPDTIGGGEVLDAQPRKHGGAPAAPAGAPAVRADAPAAPAEPRSPAAAPPPVPLDGAALRLADLLRAGGATPRADGDLAAAAGLEPAEAAELLRALVHTGRAIRVARNLHYDPDALAELTARIVAICERDGRATIAGVRDELGLSRRYAQALLEYLDDQKVTIRRGDEHVLRPRRT